MSVSGSGHVSGAPSDAAATQPAAADHSVRSLGDGLRAGLPFAVAGGLFALTFGVAARPLIGALPAIVMSAIVFAGASQFAALAVLAAGGGGSRRSSSARSSTFAIYRWASRSPRRSSIVYSAAWLGLRRLSTHPGSWLAARTAVTTSTSCSARRSRNMSPGWAARRSVSRSGHCSATLARSGSTPCFPRSCSGCSRPSCDARARASSPRAAR